MLELSLRKHSPLHIYTNEHVYFLSARCVNKAPIWNTPQKKNLFVSVLNKSIRTFDVKIYSWVLLDNHYHCIFQVDDGYKIIKFVRNLHINSGRVINDFDNQHGRHVWYQYWDYCIRNKPDFWKHFNYIIQNPVKHCSVDSLEEAYYYKFSSNPIWLNRFGREGLNESFIKYPVRDWTPTIEDE